MVITEYLNVVREGFGQSSIAKVLKYILNQYGVHSLDNIVKYCIQNYLFSLSKLLEETSILLSYSGYVRRGYGVRVRVDAVIDEKLFSEVMELREVTRELGELMGKVPTLPELLNIIKLLIGTPNEEGVLSKVKYVVDKVLRAHYYGIPLPTAFLITRNVANSVATDLARKFEELTSKEVSGKELTKELKKVVKQALRNIYGKVGYIASNLGTKIPKEGLTKFLNSLEVTYAVSAGKGVRRPIVGIRVRLRKNSVVPTET